MIYKNASVVIKGHLLENVGYKEKYVKIGVKADGQIIELLIAKDEENVDLIKAILKYCKEKTIWEFKCELNFTNYVDKTSGVSYISYFFYVKKGIIIDEKIELEDMWTDILNL